MRSYYRVMLGKQSMFAEECRNKGFIGAGYGIEEDLSGKLPEDWREFNKSMIPSYLEANPGKSKIAAGLSCGALWSISKGVSNGDIVISPNGSGKYYVGEVTSNYSYDPTHPLKHQRRVNWFGELLDKDVMSSEIQNSLAAMRSIINLDKYRDELETLIKGEVTRTILSAADETIEDPTVFALEKHLEEFLIKNWPQTPLGKTYDIYQEDENSGQQFPTDTGFIDILAISKDRRELLVVELKKGRASDSVVGQVQRYMGYVIEEVAELDQRVSGVIIALEDDLKIRRALKVAQNIDFYRYEVKFDLIKS